MRRPKSIEFMVSTTIKIPSINSTYKSRVVSVNGRNVAQVYIDKSVREYKRQVMSQLDYIDFQAEAPWIFDKDRRFTLHLLLLMSQSLNSRDADNCVKCLQDCLFRKLGLNDSRVLKVISEKRLVQGASHERVCFRLSENLTDPVFNNLEGLPRPTGIFLGGTCAGQDWRTPVISWLPADKRRYSYYNPVVPVWTQEAREAEEKFKSEQMDCFLAVITPDLKGVYSIAEVVDEAWQASEIPGSSCIFGILGKQQDYGEAQWKSLMATKDLIGRISGGSKHIVAAEISEATEICQFLDPVGWKGKRKK